MKNGDIEMSEGIVCKVWNIHGETVTRSTMTQMTDSLCYILNDEKVSKEIPLNSPIENDPMGQLGRECLYVENDIKTLNGALVGGYNLLSTDINFAVQEMMEVKEFYHKTDGRAALHGVISLPVEESHLVNSSGLMKLCHDTLSEVFPNHQAIYAVHTNTDNLHIHFIVNSVGLNGKKIHQDNNFIKGVLQPCVNKYAREYGFTPNINWEKQKKEQYKDIKIALRKQIDRAIEQSESFDDFISCLRKNGVKVNIGKHISLKMSDMPKAVRTHQLGGNYTKESIIERIMTRREAFEEIQANRYSIDVNDVYMPVTSVLKKYKDMSPKEKGNVIRQIKLGENPWKQQRQMNWQLNEISRDINRTIRIVEMVSYYSRGEGLQGAMQGILNAKKEVSAEKKKIQGLLRKNKPVIDIYKEMKTIQRKAYLYEYEGVTDYRLEFDKYRELSQRLREGYGKNVLEVSAFVKECEDSLLFAHSQLQELSNQYREIKRYAMTKGEYVPLKNTLYDIAEIQDTINYSKKMIYDANFFYVVSKTSDVILRFVRRPIVNERGNTEELIEVTVMSKEGDTLEKIDNRSGNREFTTNIRDLEKKYNISSCHKYNDITQAQEFLYTNEKDIDVSHDEFVPDWHKDSNKDKEEKVYSFTQAINFKSVSRKDGVHYILNAQNPMYMAVVLSRGKDIYLKIINRNGKMEEEIHLPSLQLRNQKGFFDIQKMQRKYGFSDEMYIFEDMDEARQYAENEKKEEEQRETNRWRG